MNMGKPLKVVVCGTTFGRIYLDAIKQLSDEYKLVGIVARGSKQAVQCAKEYDVPLYTDIEELTKEDTDLACLVVRSTVVGGQGSQLANIFLKKGIHVLQEHPVHHDDMARCFRNARQNNCFYYLNSFYPDLVTVHNFIETATKVSNISKINYIEASCSLQVLFPLVDILGKVVGGFTPWHFETVVQSTEKYPFTTLMGNIKEIPIALRVQNQINPADPDNNTHFLHRIVVGTDCGNLILTDSHGMVLWCPNMYVPRNDDGVLDIYGSYTNLKLPLMEEVVSMKDKTFQSIFTQEWPYAMKRSLVRFYNTIQGGRTDIGLNQYMLNACKVWQNISKQLGDIQLVSVNNKNAITLSAL